MEIKIQLIINEYKEELAKVMNEEMEVNPMVELYVVMVQRGLKTLEQVPARYREQVRQILEKVEK